MAQKHRYAKPKKKKLTKTQKKKKRFLTRFSFLIPFSGETEKLPKWESILILSLSLLAAGYLINNRITEYSTYIHVSDEVDNMRAVECLVQKGKIVAAVPPSYGYPPNFEISGRWFEYWVETILRVPGYWVFKNMNIDWGAYSGFWYFFLLGLGAILIVGFRKKDPFPSLALGMCMLLISYAAWSSAAFYFVRYYVFLIYAFILCQWLAVHLLLRTPKIPNLHYLGIILLSFLPAVFHKIGYMTVFVWAGIIVVDFLSKKDIRQFFSTRKNLIWISIPILVAIAGGVYFWPKMQYYFSSGMIQISWDLRPGLEKFIDLTTNTSALSFLLIGGTILGGILCFKYLSKYERALLLCNSAFTILSIFILLLFTSGQKYLGYSGHNRYPFIAHIALLLELSLLITAILKFVYQKLPKFPAKGLSIALSVMLLFLLQVLPQSEVSNEDINFSMRPRLTHQAIDKIKKQIDTQGAEKPIVVTNYGFALTAFQEYPVFFLSPPPQNAIAYDGTSGNGKEIYSTSGRGYIGTESAFCTMLDLFPGRLLFYLYIDESKADPQLRKKLKSSGLIENLVIRSSDEIRAILCQ